MLFRTGHADRPSPAGAAPGERESRPPGGPSLSAPPGSPNRIGAEITRWREERGLSILQLAARTNLGRDMIGRIESGIAPDPRASHLYAIAEVLGVPYWRLLGAAGPVARDPRELMRELSLQLQTALPMQVPEADFEIVVNGGEDAETMEDARDYWPYHPEIAEHGHRFQVVRVRGATMAAGGFEDGAMLFCDLDEPPSVGDTVIVRRRAGNATEPALIAEVMRDATDDSPTWLRPVTGAADFRLTAELVIWGVVKEKRARLRRGARVGSTVPSVPA